VLDEKNTIVFALVMKLLGVVGANVPEDVNV
jgi:hypothetical protein